MFLETESRVNHHAKVSDEWLGCDRIQLFSPGNQ